MHPLDVVAPVTQQYVDWRLRKERRRGGGMARRSPPATRRWLTARTRRYLRRRERWAATMSLPGHPASREAKQFSQNGEDGIIAAICEQIGAHDGVFVEI